MWMKGVKFCSIAKKEFCKTWPCTFWIRMVRFLYAWVVYLIAVYISLPLMLSDLLFFREHRNASYKEISIYWSHSCLDSLGHFRVRNVTESLEIFMYGPSDPLSARMRSLLLHKSSFYLLTPFFSVRNLLWFSKIHDPYHSKVTLIICTPSVLVVSRCS